MKNGHDLISHSAFYKMLTSPFYYGQFEFPVGSGNWYQGKHKPMITVAEYDIVQLILGSKGKPRRNKHDFAYRGLLRCSDCGCLITATQKVKYVQKINGFKKYVYYHCTKKSPLKPCSQPPVNKADLEKEFGEYFHKIRVTKPFLVWAEKWNQYLDEYEERNLDSYRSKYDQELAGISEKRDELLNLRLDKTISIDEFKRKSAELATEEKTRTKQFQQLVTSTSTSSRDIMDELEFAYRAKEKYVHGDKRIKRNMIMYLGSNFFLNAKKVSIQLKNTYAAIEKMNTGGMDEKGKLELVKYAGVFSKNPDLIPSNPRWLPD